MKYSGDRAVTLLCNYYYILIFFARVQGTKIAINLGNEVQCQWHSFTPKSQSTLITNSRSVMSTLCPNHRDQSLWPVSWLNWLIWSQQSKTVVTTTIRLWFDSRSTDIMPRSLGGGIKQWCCLTSARRLSVAYIKPKSRTQRPRKTKIGTEVAHVTRDSDTTFKVKGQGHRGRGHIVAASRLQLVRRRIVVDWDSNDNDNKDIYNAQIRRGSKCAVWEKQEKWAWYNK